MIQQINGAPVSVYELKRFVRNKLFQDEVFHFLPVPFLMEMASTSVVTFFLTGSAVQYLHWKTSPISDYLHEPEKPNDLDFFVQEGPLVRSFLETNKFRERMAPQYARDPFISEVWEYVANGYIVCHIQVVPGVAFEQKFRLMQLAEHIFSQGNFPKSQRQEILRDLSMGILYRPKYSKGIEDKPSF